MNHHWQRFNPPSIRRTLRRYVRNLRWNGMEEREIIRRYLYADCFGMDGMDGIVFSTPDCGDWDCINPTHQIVTFE